MPILETAKPAEFAGIKLLVDRIDVAWAHRVHMHVYPHRASAALEKLGRQPYEFRISANFDENAKRYPNLYPVALNALRQVFEEERSAELTLPTFGTLRAFLTTNMQSWSAASLSGEHCDLTFVEDASEAFTLEAQLALTQRDVEESLSRLNYLLEKVYPPLGDWGELGDLSGIYGQKPTVFDSLDAAVRELVSVRDQAELAGTLLEAKCLKVAKYCSDIERTVTDLGSARGWTVLDAMKEIWAGAIKIANDIKAKGAMQTFIVPTTMTIQQVSVRAFGTSEKAFAILELNAVNDPYAIPPGTRLRYYADAA